MRRSFAALLHDDLDLSAMPRNPAKPGYFSSYGLSPADDLKLTRWMRDRLEIAAWVWDRSRTLGAIERDVLSRLNPPINILGVQHRWKKHVRHCRRLMADHARHGVTTSCPASPVRQILLELMRIATHSISVSGERDGCGVGWPSTWACSRPHRRIDNRLWRSVRGGWVGDYCGRCEASKPRLIVATNML